AVRPAGPPIYAAVCRIVRLLQRYSLPARSLPQGSSDRVRVCMAQSAQSQVIAGHGPGQAGESRRDFLLLTASALGAVGAVSAIWPFIDSLNPAKDTLALSTTEFDMAPIQVGQRLTIAWRGKPVFIAHRTPEEIKAAADVDIST